MTMRYRMAGLQMACALWFSSQAWGQEADRPLLLPKTDVAVIYQFDKVPLNGPHKLQVTYTEGGQRVRVDLFRWVEAKFPYGSIIFDGPADRLINVDVETRSYNERPTKGEKNPGVLLAPDVTYTRQGTDMVALAQCIVWKVAAPGRSNDQDTACVTDDGITLRVTSKRASVSTLTATAIHYGPPPEGVFDPPEGFTRRPAS